MLIFWVGVGAGVSDCMNCAKPRMALSGVRSSWLMLERNSDLARLAASAAPLTSFNSASTRRRSVMSRASFA